MDRGGSHRRIRRPQKRLRRSGSDRPATGEGTRHRATAAKSRQFHLFNLYFNYLQATCPWASRLRPESGDRSQAT